MDDGNYESPIDDTPVPIPRQSKARVSGWLVGAIIGVLAGLWAFPAVRFMLASQIEFALVEESLPWLSTLDTSGILKETPRLDAVASRFPDDYLLQVGRATALASLGGISEAHPIKKTSRDFVYKENTLYRLGLVAKSFPTSPGAYAHLARYLMANRIRIQRSELFPPPAGKRADYRETSQYPDRRNLEILLWAVRQGALIDPNNAFWPTMQTVALFAAGRDDEARKALESTTRMARWDAYIYEEVLGQWRLYSAAFGDNGATQQIGPLSLVDFPHLYEMRRMAELVRWYAEQYAASGQLQPALRLRRNLAHLGIILRDEAHWALEALCGANLYFISTTDSDAHQVAWSIHSVAEWEGQATHYHQLLTRMHREYEFISAQAEAQTCCDLRKNIDIARFDASYPGIPPGIPLAPLFENWMEGICLVQQVIGALIVVAGAVLLERGIVRNLPGKLWRRKSTWVVVGVVLLCLVVLFLFVFPTPHMAGLLLGVAVLTLLFVLEHVYRWFLRKKGITNNYLELSEDGLIIERPTQTLRNLAQVRSKWGTGTTIRMVVLVVLPCLALVYSLRDLLSGLHPVAMLLRTINGVQHISRPDEALQVALLSSALPLLLPIACGAWALYRRVSPLAGALVGLRRLALPCIVCLTIAYACLLYRTLTLDTEASTAIQKAAQNDRQWVLTHGVEGQ